MVAELAIDTAVINNISSMFNITNMRYIVQVLILIDTYNNKLTTSPTAMFLALQLDLKSIHITIAMFLSIVINV